MDIFENKATFAARCGVSPAMITQWTKPGKPLAAAMSGKKINVNHPAAKKFMLAHDTEIPDQRSLSKHKRGPKKTPVPEIEESPLPEHYLKMPFEEVIRKFGTAPALVEWTKAAKLMEDLRDKRLRNDERENQYIPRDVMTKVMAEFSRCFSLQLNDAAKTIASRLKTMVKSKRSTEDMIVFTEDQIGAPIVNAKKRINDWLKNHDGEI